jgi:hypothetical protein
VGFRAWTASWAAKLGGATGITGRPVRASTPEKQLLATPQAGRSLARGGASLNFERFPDSSLKQFEAMTNTSAGRPWSSEPTRRQLSEPSGGEFYPVLPSANGSSVARLVWWRDLTVRSSRPLPYDTLPAAYSNRQSSEPTSRQSRPAVVTDHGGFLGGYPRLVRTNSPEPKVLGKAPAPSAKTAKASTEGDNSAAFTDHPAWQPSQSPVDGHRDTCDTWRHIAITAMQGDHPSRSPPAFDVRPRDRVGAARRGRASSDAATADLGASRASLEVSRHCCQRNVGPTTVASPGVWSLAAQVPSQVRTTPSWPRRWANFSLLPL